MEAALENRTGSERGAIVSMLSRYNSGRGFDSSPLLVSEGCPPFAFKARTKYRLLSLSNNTCVYLVVQYWCQKRY